ncbi:helix-turn-helix domain-containing protein [Dyadobacter sp. CY261]|uniref:helix-turn-helix domain-containing protein n=1 Tax=Dyadobacter sp. CY261 TaxID=2907203 RepID=UPI001F37C35C|nr:helix-turn-helix domain-containing protein [Dyadobacter sp. CY261]MCF0072309.1 helix-turn-helix domain-containing protein [Dyadobacter sp. CY261]
MRTREDLLKSSTYWLTGVQIEVFNLLNTYMEENNLTQRQVAEKLNVSPSYVSQILNGNFNFTISKLIELALLVGKAPIIQFETIEQILKAEAIQMKAERTLKRKKSADLIRSKVEIA